MRIAVLQHVAFEGPGAIAPWLESRGAVLSRIALHQGDPLPSLDQCDGLVVMGGPMGVHDHDQHPWLKPEQKLLQQALQAGHPVLGICLGGQLMAAALGADVRPGREREIGWWPIHTKGSNAHEGLALPDGTEVFHWHGDQFALPAGAIPLASSAICPCQGFQWGRRGLALQFHLETTPSGIEQLIAHSERELAAAGPWVQSPAALRHQAEARCQRLHQLLDQLMEHWIGDLLLSGGSDRAHLPHHL